MTSQAALWHEVECGGYRADLSLWRDLADHARGEVLDVGAGTGRVSLDLAQRDLSVTALDNQPELLEELSRRAAALQAGSVSTVCADAREFVDESRFGLVVVAMQTIQLLGGAAERERFFSCARRNTAAGGQVAVAVADLAQGAADGPVTFEPDVIEDGGERFSSRPVAVRCDAEQVVIERERVHVTAGGSTVRTLSRDHISRIAPDVIRREGLAAGFASASMMSVPATQAYAGASVVVFDA